MATKIKTRGDVSLEMRGATGYFTPTYQCASNKAVFQQYSSDYVKTNISDTSSSRLITAVYKKARFSITSYSNQINVGWRQQTDQVLAAGYDSIEAKLSYKTIMDNQFGKHESSITITNNTNFLQNVTLLNGTLKADVIQNGSSSRSGTLVFNGPDFESSFSINVVQSPSVACASVKSANSSCYNSAPPFSYNTIAISNSEQGLAPFTIIVGQQVTGYTYFSIQIDWGSLTNPCIDVAGPEKIQMLIVRNPTSTSQTIYGPNNTALAACQRTSSFAGSVNYFFSIPVEFLRQAATGNNNKCYGYVWSGEYPWEYEWRFFHNNIIKFDLVNYYT